jgi:hypothetical protein
MRRGQLVSIDNFFLMYHKQPRVAKSAINSDILMPEMHKGVIVTHGQQHNSRSSILRYLRLKKRMYLELEWCIVSA